MPAASIRAVSCPHCCVEFHAVPEFERRFEHVDGPFTVKAFRCPACSRMTFAILDRLLDLLFASA
jgi:hypothetical protein